MTYALSFLINFLQRNVNSMKNSQRGRQGGFTLIELVIVVVLIGILSAVAIPKYVDFKNDAALAASKGLAGALASASAINYAANRVNSTTALVATCEGVRDLLTTPTLAANFGIGGTAPACTVTNADGTSTPAVAWSMSNSQ